MWLVNLIEQYKTLIKEVLGITGGVGGGAPTDAEYVVSSSNPNLSAERVTTSSTTVTVNAGTVGQIAFERAALTGDVTASANSNATTISNNAVSNAKAADMAANTFKANNTASTGDPVDVAVGTSKILGRGPTGNLTALTVGSGLIVTDTTITSTGGGSGEANTASNVNVGGVGLFKQKTGVDLEFRGINAGSSKVTVTLDAANNEVDLDVAEANLNLGNMGGSLAGAQLAANAVGNGKLATMAANTVKGNSTGATANAQDMTLTGGLTMVSGAPGALKSKGSFSFGYTFSTDITETDPGAAGIKFNNATMASITEIYLDPTTSGGRNIGQYLATWGNGQVGFISNNSSSSAFGIFNITGMLNNADNFWTITATPVTGVGVMPAAGEEVLIFYWPPASGLTTQDVLNMKVVRTDANGFLINEVGTVISGSPSVADYTALVALDEAAYENFAVVVTGGLNRSVWVSNGTAFGPLNGQYVQEKSNTSIKKYIAANTGITWTAANNGSGKVRLTSSAAHGLTTSPAVGASIMVKTTQNGWTAGTFHEIATVVSTTVIDLTTNFSAHGVPVFYLANEEVDIKSFTLPVLRNNSTCIWEFNVGYSADGAGSSRRVKLYLDGTAINNNNLTSTTNQFVPFRLGFKNLGATNSQLGLSGENSTGYVGNTLVPIATAIETNTGSQTAKITFLPAAENTTMELHDYTFIIRG